MSTIPARPISDEQERPLENASSSIYMLGVRVDNIDSETALREIRRRIDRRDTRQVFKVYFTNVHSIRLAQRDRALRDCINRADLALPDGSGLSIAGKVCRHPIRENLNGTDLTPKVLKRAEEEGWSVYLLGAKPSVVEACCRRLQDQWPHLHIVGYHHGYFSPEEEAALVENINLAQPDILFVALGSPMQEKWIARHETHIEAGVCVAVGGLFDFISGVRRRAPVWMRRWGIEWLYRFAQDPRSKWRRVVIEIPWFLTLVCLSRLMPGSLYARLIRKEVVS